MADRLAEALREGVEPPAAVEVTVPRPLLYSLILLPIIVSVLVTLVTVNLAQGETSSEVRRAEQHREAILRVESYVAQVRGCRRGIEDRIVHRAESLSAWEANTVVGHDPAQPLASRRARLAQAETNAAAVRSFQARMPEQERAHRAAVTVNGSVFRMNFGPDPKPYECSRNYPRPSVGDFAVYAASKKSERRTPAAQRQP